MLELQGKHNTTKVFTDVVDEESIKQILDLLNDDNFKDSKIRIMPDTHAGAGCVIGLSMTITDKVVPNLVGVDIGCGVLTVKLADKEIDFDKLDKVIREHVPSGFDIRDRKHRNTGHVNFDGIKAPFNLQRAKLSLGTLGGGNHFISVEQDSEGNNYLLIHTGSRQLGLQIAEHYQDVATKRLKERYSNEESKNAHIEVLKKENRHDEIESFVKKFDSEKKTTFSKAEKDLAYIEGQDMEDYLNDMKIAQDYAYWNRITIMDVILENADLEYTERFDTVHNYIDIKNKILRKGAVSAQAEEKLIIPINMRDGSIIAVGKGNEDWNFTAPHGAGRLYGRRQAKDKFKLEDYQETMKGIYSTSVSEHTLDECPMAYKSIDDIVDNVKDTVDILDIIKPLYNFKAN